MKSTRHYFLIASLLAILVLAFGSVNLTSVSATARTSSSSVNWIYVEPFDDLSNSSGYRDIMLKSGNLQLNESLTQITQSLPNTSISDNWTEDFSWMNGINGTWSLSGVIAGIVTIDNSNPFVGVNSTHGAAIADDPVPGFIIAFSPNQAINVSGYDRIEFAIDTTCPPYFMTFIDSLLFAGFMIYDSMGNTATNMIIPPPFGLGNVIFGPGLYPIFTYGLDALYTTVGFNYSDVVKIEFWFDWMSQTFPLYSALGPIDIWIDYLHFEDDYYQSLYSDNGTWYSDWINGTGNLSSIMIDGQNLQNVSVYVSNDNLTFMKVNFSMIFADLSSSGLGPNITVCINITKTTTNISPLLSSIAIIYTKPSSPYVPPPQGPPGIDPYAIAFLATLGISIAVIAGLGITIGVIRLRASRIKVKF